MEEFVDPRPAENRNLVLFVEVEQAGADHLGYRQHPVDGVAEKMGERVGIDAAQLEPQRCRLQDIALGGGEARCPNEVRIAGTVDENIRSIGEAASLVLTDDMAEEIALHHAVRKPADRNSTRLNSSH